MKNQKVYIQLGRDILGFVFETAETVDPLIGMPDPLAANGAWKAGCGHPSNLVCASPTPDRRWRRKVFPGSAGVVTPKTNVGSMHARAPQALDGARLPRGFEMWHRIQPRHRCAPPLTCYNHVDR